VQWPQPVIVLLLLLRSVLGASGQSQPCPTEFHYGENPAAGHFAVVNGYLATHAPNRAPITMN